MTWVIRGLIEGFYGRPWTWDERLEVIRTCAANEMTHYVYAPKDDPKHREAWREPYTSAELDGFRRLVAGSDMVVGFGISPGLDVNLDNASDRSALASKVDQAVASGIGLVVLGLDDLPTADVDPARRGHDHADLTNWLFEVLAGRADLAVIPTDYVGTVSSPYLRELDAAIPVDVPIGWTGCTVVNDRISAGEATERAQSLSGRPPLLWDNYPVNDGMMADRLFLGPLRGRDPALANVCCGYLANAMVQPRCSTLPLASVAGFLRDEDPDEAWATAAGDLRTFAEACDGSVPAALAEHVAAALDGPRWFEAARPLVAWMAEAEVCGAPGLEDEADEWLSQVHREARLGSSALRLIHALRPAATVDEAGRGRVTRPDADAVVLEAFGLAMRWPRVRRSARTVCGSRGGFRAVIDQWADGRWRFHPGSLDPDSNATDLLVRTAFAALADAPSPAESEGPVEVLADGVPVDVSSKGTFRAPPGSLITVRLNGSATDVQSPALPPVGSI